VNSSVVGMTKPDPAIYGLACSRLGVLPWQALLIDDSRSNVEGAQKAGLQALQYTNEDTIAQAAQLLGLHGSRDKEGSRPCSSVALR